MDSYKLFLKITTYKPYYTERVEFLKNLVEQHNKRCEQGKGELAYAELEKEIIKDYEKWKTKTG
jgi:hypothetical protein